ncbi:helix-turn-helix transcriptional regulator [Nonomuraea endophytica]|uniref:helix-turn-helix transcriptional regulator n=1 Tax=Nonomuraea endophytica TaxID=714136 RepID=UPI001622F726
MLRERGVVTHQPEQRNSSQQAGLVKPSRPGLIRARLQRGLTQERAAEQIGVSLSTWARWERGTQNRASVITAARRRRVVEGGGWIRSTPTSGCRARRR